MLPKAHGVSSMSKCPYPSFPSWARGVSPMPKFRSIPSWAPGVTSTLLSASTPPFNSELEVPLPPNSLHANVPQPLPRFLNFWGVVHAWMPLPPLHSFRLSFTPNWPYPSLLSCLPTHPISKFACAPTTPVSWLILRHESWLTQLNHSPLAVTVLAP